jgi:hypothetical protein
MLGVLSEKILYNATEAAQMLLAAMKIDSAKSRLSSSTRQMHPERSSPESCLDSFQQPHAS